MTKKPTLHPAQRAHVCGKDGCQRITLRRLCERCSLAEMLRKLSHGQERAAA